MCLPPLLGTVFAHKVQLLTPFQSAWTCTDQNGECVLHPLLGFENLCEQRATRVATLAAGQLRMPENRRETISDLHLLVPRSAFDRDDVTLCPASLADAHMHVQIGEIQIESSDFFLNAFLAHWQLRAKWQPLFEWAAAAFRLLRLSGHFDKLTADCVLSFALAQQDCTLFFCRHGPVQLREACNQFASLRADCVPLPLSLGLYQPCLPVAAFQITRLFLKCNATPASNWSASDAQLQYEVAAWPDPTDLVPSARLLFSFHRDSLHFIDFETNADHAVTMRVGLRLCSPAALALLMFVPSVVACAADAVRVRMLINDNRRSAPIKLSALRVPKQARTPLQGAWYCLPMSNDNADVQSALFGHDVQMKNVLHAVRVERASLEFSWPQQTCDLQRVRQQCDALRIYWRTINHLTYRNGMLAPTFI